MATQKTTSLTARENGRQDESRRTAAHKRTTMDSHSFAVVGELDTGDVTIFNMPIPSNAIVHSFAQQNEDMDTGTGTLVVDIGVAAANAFTSVTSGVSTKHAKDDVIDSDIIVDGGTSFALSTGIILSAANLITSAANRGKALFEVLGYDEDPQTVFNVCLTAQVGSNALSTAANCYIVVEYFVD